MDLRRWRSLRPSGRDGSRRDKNAEVCYGSDEKRQDEKRNEYIRSTVKEKRLGMKMQEGRLRWYGHVMRRDQEYVGRRMMEMELPGRRRRVRPKRRFLDVVKEDIEEVGAKETDVKDRILWRNIIRCGYP